MKKIAANPAPGPFDDLKRLVAKGRLYESLERQGRIPSLKKSATGKLWVITKPAARAVKKSIQSLRK